MIQVDTNSQIMRGGYVLVFKIGGVIAANSLVRSSRPKVFRRSLPGGAVIQSVPSPMNDQYSGGDRISEVRSVQEPRDGTINASNDRNR
jgi:hypothetical protein